MQPSGRESPYYVQGLGFNAQYHNRETNNSITLCGYVQVDADLEHFPDLIQLFAVFVLCVLCSGSLHARAGFTGSASQVLVVRITDLSHT